MNFESLITELDQLATKCHDYGRSIADTTDSAHSAQMQVKTITAGMAANLTLFVNLAQHDPKAFLHLAELINQYSVTYIKILMGDKKQ